jgi:hypothetical protein
MMEIGFDKASANSFRIQFGIPSRPGALERLSTLSL